MGLDFFDEKATKDVIIDPFLDRVKTEILPALEAIIERRLAALVSELLDGRTITIGGKPKGEL